MFLDVHFNEEVPQIGTGRRIVFVESEGHKWVRLRDPFTHASAKLAKPVWQKLIRRSIPAKVRRSIIKRTAKEHGREKTDVTKAMLRACT